MCHTSQFMTPWLSGRVRLKSTCGPAERVLRSGPMTTKTAKNSGTRGRISEDPCAKCLGPISSSTTVRYLSHATKKGTEIGESSDDAGLHADELYRLRL